MLIIRSNGKGKNTWLSFYTVKNSWSLCRRYRNKHALSVNRGTFLLCVWPSRYFLPMFWYLSINIFAWVRQLQNTGVARIILFNFNSFLLINHLHIILIIHFPVALHELHSVHGRYLMMIQLILFASAAPPSAAPLKPHKHDITVLVLRRGLQSYAEYLYHYLIISLYNFFKSKNIGIVKKRFIGSSQNTELVSQNQRW